jgi:hypothetical protein
MRGGLSRGEAVLSWTIVALALVVAVVMDRVTGSVLGGGAAGAVVLAAGEIALVRRARARHRGGEVA